MKSIKPGRGPSFMSGIAAVGITLFGIIWTFAAASMGAPFFFPLFGIVFIGMGIATAVYNFKNATSRNRYSVFEITNSHDEPDPFDPSSARPHHETPVNRKNGVAEKSRFCPYCGAEANPDFEFCKQCGKKLP